MTIAAPLAFLALLLAAFVAWLAGPPWWRRHRRARVLRQPFPPAWRAVLRRRMPAFARLPPPLQLELKRQVRVLLAEVPVIGCAGLEVDDEMRVLVAAQAALLLLGRGGGFDGLRRVLLYPGAFVEPGGTSAPRIGESWSHGTVVLGWEDVVAGAADPDDGRNVVLHEFAHRLDQAGGKPANGAPWLPGRRTARERWAAVLGAEFAALRARLARGEEGLIEPYAATDAAEFFACVSELFFERPLALRAAHPALYAQFAACYRLDPAAWAVPPSSAA